MLNINNDRLLSTTAKKASPGGLTILAILLLLGGLCCLMNPLGSGIMLSVIMGVFLLISGLALIAVMFSWRQNNFWPLLGGIVMGVAYLALGYLLVTHPLAGLLSMAIFLSALFILGGVTRLIAGVRTWGMPGCLMQIVVGIMDLVIGWMLLSSGPATSMSFVAILLGIEMLFSSLSLFMVARLLKQAQ